jgi:beta-phosphoglucomutase
MVNQIRAIIWDMDGVIIDSAEAHRLAWYRMALEAGLPFSDEQFAATFGMRNDRIFAVLWGEMPAERIKELSDRKETYFREFVREKVGPLPGAIELLATLQDAGYAQALASSAPIKNIEVISETLGLGKYLSALVSGETVPHGKPAPDVFLKAATELGIEPAYCLVIEDAVAGVEAAHAGGMRCIAVAGDRDLPGLHAAELMVKDLTQVTIEKIRNMA